MIYVPRVIIESPFRGDRERNHAYLKAAIRDSIKQGESPYASHAINTLVLDDNDPDERRLGMSLALSWLPTADFVAVYADLGITEGMREGIANARRLGIEVQYRRLGSW